MKLTQLETVPYPKEKGYCRIRTFDLNSPKNTALGEPKTLPADSFLISDVTTEKQTHILLDAGKKGQGQHVVIPQLLAEGITHLDQVIISHIHRDHYGGVIDVLQDSRLTVGQIIHSPVAGAEEIVRTKNPGAYDTWLELNELLKQQQSITREISVADIGSQISIGDDTFFEIIAVPMGELVLHSIDSNHINNLNLVLKFTHRHFSALFPGDCGSFQSEQILQSPLRNRISDVFYLKAAHHGKGESLSDKLIKHCNAQVVVIPCNENIVNGSDFPENWQQYSANGAKVFRTDHYRDVTLYSDGNSAVCFAQTNQYTERTHFPTIR